MSDIYKICMDALIDTQEETSSLHLPTAPPSPQLPTAPPSP